MKIKYNFENRTVEIDGIVYDNWELIPTETKIRIPSEFYLSILSFLVPVPDEVIIQYELNY